MSVRRPSSGAARVLLVAGLLGAVLASGCQAPETPASPELSSGLAAWDRDKQAAVATAKREVEKRGWPDYEVDRVRFANGRWWISVSHRPALIGGHAEVIVSLDGEFMNWEGGR